MVADTTLTKPPEVIHDVTAIYIGRGRTSTGKLCGFWITPEEYDHTKSGDDLREIASAFEAKLTDLPRAVGAHYRARGEIVKGHIQRLVTSRRSRTFIGNGITNIDLLAQLEARDEAEIVAARAVKLEAEIAADSSLKRVLKTLRGRYTATDRIGRLALEVVLLDALRNH